MVEERERTTTRLAWTAVGCFVFVAVAVVAEAVAGSWANSPAPLWAEDIVPLAWPRPLRVTWWLTVAAAAGGFRMSLHRLGFRPRPSVTALTVAPFVVFAAGVAVGADWATWH